MRSLRCVGPMLKRHSLHWLQVELRSFAVGLTFAASKSKVTCMFMFMKDLCCRLSEFVSLRLARHVLHVHVSHRLYTVKNGSLL